MPVSEQQQIPYDVTLRVWRDEQPGDEPTLNLSAIFVPRDPATTWQQPRLQTIELHANDRRWTPRESSLSSLGGGGFELKASGDATLPADATATATVTVETVPGPRKFTLPATKIARID